MRDYGVWRMFSRYVLLVAAVLAIAEAGKITFRKESRDIGIRAEGWMSNWRPEQNRYWGATVFDSDGNGFYDLCLSNHQDNTEFYFGGIGGKFKYKDTRTPKNDIHATAAYDFDGDGVDDIMMVRGGQSGSKPVLPVVSKVNANSRALRKVDPTQYGITEKVRGRSIAFFDMDGDGDRDCLMVNRHKKGVRKSHIIYENVNGRFRVRRTFGFEETVAAWFCLSDLDRNKYLDVILMGFGFAEVWMGNGNFQFKRENWRLPDSGRIQGLRGCAEMDVDNDGIPELYFVRGDEKRFYSDILLKQSSNGSFRDISRQWNLPKGGKHSHITTYDADNDGKIDAYISVMTWYKKPRVPDILLKNMGRKFVRVPLGKTGVNGLSKPYNRNEDGDNAVAFDFNNDGLVDLLVGSRRAPWRLYKNITPRGLNHYTRIAVGRPRMGIFSKAWDKDQWGALIIVYCANRKFTQRTGSPGMSHSTSNMYRLTFGVGRCRTITRVEASYIGGVKAWKYGGPTNREIKIGLMNCPGPRCNRGIPRCLDRCPNGKRCETNLWGTNKKQCPL